MPSVKQGLAKAGVVPFIFWWTAGAWGAFVGPAFLPLFLATWLWMPCFILAAILPESERDSWGSIWPLSGYDNAIDAIYTRGPWLVRYAELDEAKVDRDVTDGLKSLFAPDSDHN